MTTSETVIGMKVACYALAVSALALLSGAYASDDPTVTLPGVLDLSASRAVALHCLQRAPQINSRTSPSMQYDTASSISAASPSNFKIARCGDINRRLCLQREPLHVWRMGGDTHAPHMHPACGIKFDGPVGFLSASAATSSRP